MKTFKIISKVSKKDVIAEGVVFATGQVLLCHLGDVKSIIVHNKIGDVNQIFDNDDSEVVYDDDSQYVKINDAKKAHTLIKLHNVCLYKKIRTTPYSHDEHHCKDCE